MRAFFAIDLPDREQRLLAAAQQRMRRAVRGVGPKWVDPGQLHVTLKFLGDVDRSLEDALVESAVAAAAATPPIQTRVEKIATFGPPARARVIVATLADPDRLFVALAGRLEEAAVRLGVPTEQRKFVPHVTVARIKRPHDPSAYLGEARMGATDFVCRDLVFYQSELRPEGPVYAVIRRERFSGTGAPRGP
jgi:2'-5' RNA ligase